MEIPISVLPPVGIHEKEMAYIFEATVELRIVAPFIESTRSAV